MKFDVVRLLGAIYRGGCTDTEWLSGIVHAASDEPVFAYSFETAATSGVSFGPMVDNGIDDGTWREHVRATVQSVEPAWVDACFRKQASFSLVSRWAARSWVQRILRATQMADVAMTIRTTIACLTGVLGPAHRLTIQLRCDVEPPARPLATTYRCRPRVRR